MAEKLTGESANKEHNFGARLHAIQQLHAALIPLEKKQAEIIEEMRALRQQFKADTGITIGDFMAARRIAMIDNDDERHSKINNVREVYNVLKPSEQLNWLDNDNAE